MKSAVETPVKLDKTRGEDLGNDNIFRDLLSARTSRVVRRNYAAEIMGVTWGKQEIDIVKESEILVSLKLID